MKKNIADIKNNRLKRLRLKLLIYNLEVLYLPGRYMYIADLLSRNFIDNRSKDDPLMNDVVHTVSEMSMKLSDERSKQIQLETSTDPILKQIVEYCRQSWPNNRKLAGEAAHYYKMRNDIFLENNLVYYNNRLIVPTKLREFYLKTLHETHIGIVKTKEKARNLLYWPGIMANIESMISNCHVCNRYSNFNRRDSLRQHDIPEYPFQKIGIDIAQYDTKNYLILEDYYSRWLEVEELPDKTSTSVIKTLQAIFSRFGIPQIVVSDNMPFDSDTYKNFVTSNF
ncbi:Integrase zinc binding domain [Popillia japonica]|uniref:RNA-directed DNA polymerase n=1 Tax=Popillia japonica TaxID=7064 RepID=A0AAW1IDA7_POPJA